MKLLSGIPAKINLIPFNPWPGAPYECSDWGTIEKFAEVVNRAGYASPVRTPARTRYHGGMRATQERKRQGTGVRPDGGDALRRTREDAALMRGHGPDMSQSSSLAATDVPMALNEIPDLAGLAEHFRARGRVHIPQYSDRKARPNGSIAA